jgi:hypothetical protein
MTATLLGGCGPILHREMLGESIRSFSSKLKGTEKLWVTGAWDSGCDAGCGACKDKGGAASALGGLFGPKAAATGPGPHDALAYEVFTNYLTQRKKARVIEAHRHNYATELNPETMRKIEVTTDGNKVSTTSCEDLCLLDQAKKRKAEKVLVYSIIEMKGDQLTIHFRLSDVVTGMVELSQTLKVVDLQAFDYSYGTGGGGAPRRSRGSSSGGGGNEAAVD